MAPPAAAPGGPGVGGSRADAAALEALAQRVEDEIATVAAREPVVRAWVRRHPDDVLRACVADAPAGPLHGFTVGVKDVIDTVELPTQCNSPIWAGRVAEADASAVALVRAAGAVVTGKTVTTEFAYFTPGPTTNPHDPERTPGGSSSGSAAAVAAQMVRVAFGTQTGGSIIRPGSFCGVVAFKPTFDAAPFHGVHPLAASLDTLGWYARTIDDVELVLSVLTAQAGTAALPPAPRIGLYRTHDESRAEPGTIAELERVAAALDAAGAEVVELDPFPSFAGLGAAHGVIMAAEACRAMAWERLTHPELVSAQLTKLIATGAAVTGQEYADAQRQAVAGRATLHETFGTDRFDALLTPAAPGEAPLGLTTTGSAVFNRVWTMLRVPCVTLPAATGPHGLPVGVQLVGARWADRELLATARFVATALDLAV